MSDKQALKRPWVKPEVRRLGLNEVLQKLLMKARESQGASVHPEVQVPRSAAR